VQRAARKAGLTESGVHLLRHSFCSHLAMRGASAKAIQELAGHRDLTTTQMYMHLSPAALEDAIRLLDGDGHGTNRGEVEAAGIEPYPALFEKRRRCATFVIKSKRGNGFGPNS